MFFFLLLNQINNPEYFNIYKLNFFYNTVNVTNLFLNNEEVIKLNLRSMNPIIEVVKIN